MRTVSLKVTSAFLVGGKIAKVGQVVEVSEADAKALLHRGKAVLAVVQPAQADAPDTDPTEARVALIEDDQPRRRRRGRSE